MTPLAALASDRATAILARGRAFGESRIVCGAHHASAVEGGRLSATATLTAIGADPAFARDLATARAELDALRRDPATAQSDAATCAQETAMVATYFLELGDVGFIVIASAAKQPGASCAALGCFAALAMTTGSTSGHPAPKKDDRACPIRQRSCMSHSSIFLGVRLTTRYDPARAPTQAPARAGVSMTLETFHGCTPLSVWHDRFPQAIADPPSSIPPPAGRPYRDRP